MVDIAFTPAIGETIQVPISDCCDERDTITVRFTAVLGHTEYRQVVEGRLKVQVYSDVPSLDVQGWRAYDFEVPMSLREGGLDAVTDLSPTSDSEKVLLARISGGYSSEEKALDDVPLRAQRLEALIPISVRNARNFAFTYRLVHPWSGDVQWLGNWGHDGHAVIVREGFESRGVQLAKGWSEAGRAFVLDGTESGPVSVVEFEEGGYDVWTFPRDVPSSDSDAELLFALPRDFGFPTRNPSFVIHASPGAVMHLGAGSKSLQASGKGHIMIHACYNLQQLRTLLHLRPLESGGMVKVDIVGDVRNGCEFLFVTSAPPPSSPTSLSAGGSRAPFKFVLIPIGAQRSTSELELDLGELVRGLGGELKEVAVVTGTNSTDGEVRTCFFKAPFEERSCTFIVPAHGGEFVLSPVYNFAVSSPVSPEAQDEGMVQEEEECKMVFLTTHMDVTCVREGVGVTLPTPPPSPQFSTKGPQTQARLARGAENIPSTRPHGEKATGELRRRRLITSSSSSSGPKAPSSPVQLPTKLNRARPTETQAKQGHPVPTVPSQGPFTLLYLFLWLRYVLLLVQLFLGGDLREGKGRDVKPMEGVSEKKSLNGFDKEDSAGEEQSEGEDEKEDQEVEGSGDDEEQEEETEIHAPKPSLPPHSPRSQRTIKALYADLCHSAGASKAEVILSVNRQTPSLTPALGAPIHISTLKKVLTVNGEVPEWLKVTCLVAGNSGAKGMKYLVSFSLPAVVDEQEGVRVRIAQT